MNVQEIWLRMSQVNRVQPLHALKIINELKQLNKVNRTILYNCGLNEVQSLQFLNLPIHRVSSALNWLENKENRMITFIDPMYPFLLKQIHSPPLVLFTMGENKLLNAVQVAVIGSRQASEYGRKWANIFIQKFVSYGLTVTSGLALGIDGIAHRSALECHGHTLAVLGSGLAQIYPRQHSFLADQIKQEGLLISEYLPDTPPLPKQFPRRNRIISGLSKAIVVIEAGMKSGSLITARYALEQNRDLFTLPAPLGNAAFSGNHWLQQQGAYLLANPEDILQHLECELNWIQPELEIEDKPELEFNLTEIKILGMVEYQAIPVDVIADRMQMPVMQVISILTEMEIKGIITCAAGGYIRSS